MTNIEAMEKLLRNLSQKYNLMNEIYNCTKEMEQAALQNDTQVFGMVLDMRQKSMDKVDLLDKSNAELVEMLPKGDRAKISEILRPTNKVTVSLENPLETNIFDTQKRVTTLVKKIITADTELNKIVSKNT